ncbi:ChbG/HpnK family deacetylase [Legionella maioricensis]|uniref:ChbG/HpnK family deacetylase n=1 Tax=Legionella maioricensis TaxID=2896528 RepID=A0A9X2D3A6_9GAMM|nr:ChbG/HpnK family deacetylase [Legionella maioricensis]MCL9685472.1 ChbG/HpnK family deacetylase [Legionella maioricensis]MCL9689156.1 ChbG/HpnK family deacetylase [Legionella maioricensis]
MSDFKTIVLCADDFGLNSGVSQGILKLVQMRRLSAVGCMTNMPDFNLHAKDLCALKREVQTGLHFNLTEGYFLSEPERPCFSLNNLLIKSHLHLLNLDLIAKEFNAQLDHFIQMMGEMPDFIDGHEHVHQFPGIRRVILDIYEQRIKPHRAWIRSTYPSITIFKYWFKGMILAMAGGRKLHAELKKLTIPHHHYFAGVYDFAPDADYPALFKHWLTLVPSDTLIMCHPGDCLIPSMTRLIELNYFLSDEFVNDCQEHRVRLFLSTSPKSGEDEAINRD